MKLVAVLLVLPLCFALAPYHHVVAKAKLLTGGSDPTLSVPTLTPFDFDTDLASHTGRGYALIANSYPTNTPVVRQNSTIAVDHLNKRALVDVGIYGTTFFFENATYQTTFSDVTNSFICGIIRFGWAVEKKALSYLNNKGPSIVTSSQPPFVIPVTNFNGYGTDNSNCNQSMAYSWLVDSFGGVRRIYADAPIQVPGETGYSNEIIKEYYEYDDITFGIPDPALFELPAVCSTPFDWCATFFPAGSIAFYQPADLVP